MKSWVAGEDLGAVWVPKYKIATPHAVLCIGCDQHEALHWCCSWGPEVWE